MIVGTPKVIERFYYGKLVVVEVEALDNTRGYGGSPQFAYVLQGPALDPQRLAEAAATNRGVNVKAFDNTHEALAWLGLDPYPQA